ncbi:uncharacterized protein KD926_002073 [Aspergillus affinis]|uniref:uncharacterized protein n=1 Tax=Aspergillus affinis TaxID=1070780 RepID=UPI0022FF3574|nr:uncharacterized protein KD926_002073 [Aspergillus affinis]KAI9036310.1 hypothetical protein KD926_002073 [Aspergillus affinis]
MPVNFFSLPPELRNEIYTYLLIRREPINPWNGDNELHPKILLTNTAVLHEARALLYGHNRFDLKCEPGQISEFLDTIGFINASHLQCIYIDFPRFHNVEEEVSLEEGSLHDLEIIQSYCTDIRKLITNFESTIAMETWLVSFDSPTICVRALALIAARFRAISSLQEIVIEVDHDQGPIQREMKSHGWILQGVMLELVGEWEDFEGDVYPDNDCDDDDYDDNDGWDSYMRGYRAGAFGHPSP